MIYLNHAATSWPKPDCVLRAVQEALAAPPAGQHRSSADFSAADAPEHARELMAHLLGVEQPQAVHFTQNATEAANLLIRGIVGQGGEILATQAEHNCVLRPLFNQHSARVRLLPCDENGFVCMEALVRLLTPDTRAVFVNHVSNVTGAIQPMAAIGRALHEAGIPLVADVSQSLGCVPVDLEAWHASAAFFTGHKALMGPQGCGGFYLTPDWPLPPLMYGGNGIDSARLTYDGDAPYEVGTRNSPALAGLSAGAQWVLDRGVEQIQRHEAQLRQACVKGLQAMEGVTVFGLGSHRDFGPVVSFQLQGIPSADVGYMLSAGYGITVRTGLHCAPELHRILGAMDGGTIRVSFGAQTTMADVSALLTAVQEILEGVKAACT